MRRLLSLGSALLLVGSQRLAGQKPDLVVPRVDHRPVIDGVLDEPLWGQAAVLDQWVQVKPADNGKPNGRTIARLAYGPDAIYIGIEAYDEPGKIRYRLHERDAVVMQGQDYISIQLDPFNDRRRAFMLVVNPIGVQGDGITVEGSGYQDWDAIYDAAGKVADDHYTVEVAIPFKSLRLPKLKRQRWGLALGRNYGRDNALDMPWSLNRDLACELCQMITLSGLDEIEPTRGFELNPAVVGRLSKARPALGAPFDPIKARGEFGANLKYGVTQNLTLDATYNPDFSQVEADAGQLEINNRFALFFPEKRPFFLEGTDIFLTRFGLPGQPADYFTPPINLFYSRRIIDPDGGGKLTGKVGRFTIGALGASDAASGYDIGEPLAGRPLKELDPYYGENAQVGVARVKFDALSDGFIGSMVTARRFGDGYNLVGSIDSRLRLGTNTTFRLLAAHSATHAPNVMAGVRSTLTGVLHDSSTVQSRLDSLPSDVLVLDGSRSRGDAVHAQLEWKSRHWNLGLGYLDITPAFQTDLGFTPRTDMIEVAGQAQHVYRSTGFVRELDTKLRFEEIYSHDRSGRIGGFGEHTDRLVSLNLDFMLPAASYFSLGYTRAFLRLSEIDFPDLGRAFIYLGSQAWRWIGFDLFIRAGEEAIYVDEVDAGPPLPNYFLNPSLTTVFRPFAALRLDAGVSASKVWRREGSRERSSLYAQSAIPRVRAQLQLTKSLGIRAIGEYRLERFYQRSGALFSKRDVLSTDLLLTYLLHPGQSLQAGWSTRASGDLDLPLVTTARGGVIKVTYLWRL